MGLYESIRAAVLMFSAVTHNPYQEADMMHPVPREIVPIPYRLPNLKHRMPAQEKPRANNRRLIRKLKVTTVLTPNPEHENTSHIQKATVDEMGARY